MTDETERQKPLTAAQVAARKAFRAEEAKTAMSDHDAKERTFNENRERLKSERLAREAEAKGK